MLPDRSLSTTFEQNKIRPFGYQMEDELQSQFKVLCSEISPASRDIGSAIRDSESLTAGFEELCTAIEQLLPDEWAGKSFIHPYGSTAIGN